MTKFEVKSNFKGEYLSKYTYLGVAFSRVDDSRDILTIYERYRYGRLYLQRKTGSKVAFLHFSKVNNC